MSEAQVHVFYHDDLALVELDRPKANAMNLEFVRMIAKAFDDLDEKTHSVVITGRGKAFSAGLDLKEIPEYDEDQQDELVLALNELCYTLWAYPKPLVAAVNGHAIAGGMVLMLGADLRVSTEDPNVRFGVTEVKVGVPFPLGPKEVVMGALGEPLASWYMLGGDLVDPDSALNDGLIHEVTKPDRVVARAMELARERAALPTEAYARIKRQIREPALQRIKHAVANRSDPFQRGWLTEDAVASAKKIL